MAQFAHDRRPSFLFVSIIAGFLKKRL